MAEAHLRAWGNMRRIATEQADLVTWVLDEVRDRGPLTAAEIESDVPRRADNWGWNWSDTKSALEWLFWTGEVTASGRNSAFARVYDLTERVLPAEIVNTATPSEPDAYRELVRVAAAALGVAAEVELRDYFRLGVDASEAANRPHGIRREYGLLAPLERQPVVHGDLRISRTTGTDPGIRIVSPARRTGPCPPARPFTAMSSPRSTPSRRAIPYHVSPRTT